jgi:hypothetical protein
MKTRQLKTLALLTLAAIAAVLVSGCAHLSGERTATDGSRLAIRSTRILWASEGIKSTVTDANGLSFTLSVDKSNPDAQAIGAAAEGVARGLAGAAGKPPIAAVLPPSPVPMANATPDSLWGGYGYRLVPKSAVAAADPAVLTSP